MAKTTIDAPTTAEFDTLKARVSGNEAKQADDERKIAGAASDLAAAQTKLADHGARLSATEAALTNSATKADLAARDQRIAAAEIGIADGASRIGTLETQAKAASAVLSLFGAEPVDDTTAIDDLLAQATITNDSTDDTLDIRLQVPMSADLTRRMALAGLLSTVSYAALAKPHVLVGGKGNDHGTPPVIAISNVVLSNASFIGGSADGTVVGVISVQMTGGLFSGTLSLTGTDASSFAIDGTNLVTVGILDPGSYDINIVATQAEASGSPFTSAQTITGSAGVTLTGITLSSASFAGGSTDGTVVGAITVQTTGGLFSGSLSLTGTDAARFAISGSNLVLSGTQATGSYSVNIVATQAGAVASPFTQAETITGVQVVTLTGITLSNSSFKGGDPDGTIVGEISVQATGGLFSGTLSVTGTDAAKFAISGGNLVLNGTQAAGSYDINIVATQTGASGSPFTSPETITGSVGITLTGVTLSNSSFVGGSVNGTVVGAITVQTTGGLFTGTLSLTGADAASFAISGSNLVLNGTQSTGSYDINIVATQSGASGSPLTSPKTITGSAPPITLTGVTLSNSSFVGGSASGTVVGVISVQATGGLFTGSLSLSGTDAARFSISGSNLVLNGSQAAGTYSVNVVATQTGATGSPLSSAKTITGSVPIAITGVTLSNASFVGGSADNTVVGAISVQTTGGAFSGTLSLGGRDTAKFEISGNNLILNGTQPAGTYLVDIVATMPGATGSPFSSAKTITGSVPFTLTGITLSSDTFTGGVASGTVVGAIGVQTTGGVFGGSLSLTGADASSFAISGSNLVTSGVVATGSYDVNIVATQSGASGSPLSVPFSLTAVDASATTQVTTFQVAETAGASSLGYKRVGLVFKDGDVPAGSRVKLQRGVSDIAAQFDNRYFYPSGALQGCTACFRDSDFSAGENRTYIVMREAGAFSNASALSLSSALSGTDYKVVFSGIVGSTSGSVADLTASLNTHAAVATRVTHYESGPVCDSWEVWGMAGSHAHLKTVWNFTAWKDAGGSVVARELAPVIAQDWWSIAGKEKLTYTATLQDGASAIESYSSVEHIYGAQWALVRKADDHQHARRHWRGATRPTLIYKPNRTYWISTGMVPPLDLSTSYTMPSNTAANSTYIPGAALGHRGAVEAPSSYMGRGILPNADCIAFATQLPADVRTAVVNAHVGLHNPSHYRSNRTRTRPGDGAADTANTPISLILWDEAGPATPTSDYDFTADGMPTYVHAYNDPRNEAAYMDGYVVPSGGTTSGATQWSTPTDRAHCVAYSYFAYLLEGERYMLESGVIDMATKCANSRLASINDGLGADLWWNAFGTPAAAIYPGATAQQWSGICVRDTYNERAIAWTLNLLAGTAVVPTNHVARNYLAALRTVNLKFLARAIGQIPAGAVGGWQVTGGGSPWMTNWIPQTAYTLYERTKDANAKIVAEWGAQFARHFAEINRVGMCQIYHGAHKKSMATIWNAATNPWFSDGAWFDIREAVSGDAATDRITCAPFYNIPWQTGDEIVTVDHNAQGTFATIPGMTLGTRYYVGNVSGNTFQVFRNPDGTGLVDITANFSGLLLGVNVRGASSYANQAFPAIADDRGKMCQATIELAYRNGHPDVTATHVQRYRDYFATVDNRQWATWNLKAA